MFSIVFLFADPAPANVTEYSILSAAEARKGGDKFRLGKYTNSGKSVREPYTCIIMIRHHSLVCRCGIADFIVFYYNLSMNC